MFRSALTMLFMFSLAFGLPLMFDRDGFFRFGARTALEINEGSTLPLAPGAPRQTMLPKAEQFLSEMDDFEILAVAEYDMDALVLGRQNYEYDLTSSISPTDLALGWGMMSVPANRKYFKLTQQQRNSRLWFSRNGPASMERLMLDFSNTHMIPADDEVRRDLANVREGDLIRFSGYLVKVRSLSGTVGDWNSSLTRDDEGNGACEIVLVTGIETSNSRAGL